MNGTVTAALGIGGAAVAVATHLPYLADTVRGRTKPHAVSWLTWAALNAIAFAGQRVGAGGAGSWITGIMCAISVTVFVLSLVKGDRNITRFDWGCLVFALAAVPMWLLSATPLWSMVLVSVIDAVAFAPTFRKTYREPAQETVLTFAGNVVKWALSIAAMETLSVTTVTYPASLLASNAAFAAMVLLRRRRLARVTAALDV